MAERDDSSPEKASERHDSLEVVPPGEPAPNLGDAGEVRLDIATQDRNGLIYAALVSLIYLAAPVLYVGFVQASLCKRLETSDAMANLPSSVYLAMQWFPVFIAWLVPQARLLKTTISVSYLVCGVMGALVAAVLLIGAPSEVIVWSLVIHAGVLGCANGAAFTFNWECFGRGVSERRRGKALAWAFGWGPGFAVAGSLGAQLILDGNLFGWSPPVLSEVQYPYSFALLFGASLPIMAFGAYLAQLYRFPMPVRDAEREPFKTAVLGGFKQIVGYRVLLFACIAYLLIYCGNMVQNNMSLVTREKLGVDPDTLVGYQLALRFSFKMLAGFLLGWLLTRTNPKVPLLVTAALQILGVIWVLLVPGGWFMLAFGINGAGELFGVYYVNYPVACSPKSQIRRNIAFLMMVSSLVSFAPIMYGWVSDTWSLTASFWVALGILGVTTALVAALLPARPRPRAEDMTEADLEQGSLDQSQTA